MHLGELPLSSGGSVIVEVDLDDVDEQDMVRASPRPGRVVMKARESLEDALRSITPAVTAMTEWARSISPDECTVEFGIKVGGESGVVIAKGKAEANLTVKMTWKTDQPAD